MCVNKRGLVVFVVGIVLLATLAAPAVGQIALTRPVTVDVATSWAVLVLLRNDTLFEIGGFTLSLLNTGDSPVGIWRASVARFDPSSTTSTGIGYGFVADDNDNNIRDIDEEDEGVSPAARIVHILRDDSAYSTVVNSNIAVGDVFLMIVHFSVRAPDGAILLISPAWGNTITIISSAGQ
jgi:hypothetical protein